MSEGQQETLSNTTTTDSPPGISPALSEEVLMKEIPCICKDGEKENVRVALLLQSKTFENIWKDLGMSSDNPQTDSTFPVKNISVNIFKKVVDWMENHVGKPPPTIEEDPNTRERKWFTFNDYETEFFKVGVDELAEFLMAANFLDIPSLYIYGCQAMAALIKDKSPEEIRNLLGLEDDLTEDEKAEIRRKNVWCNY